MKGDNTRRYDKVSREQVEAMLAALSAHGSVITGNNPWTIDTRKHGVILRGEWSEAESSLAVTVADADWYVPHGAVWSEIDPLIRTITEGG